MENYICPLPEDFWDKVARSDAFTHYYSNQSGFSLTSSSHSSARFKVTTQRVDTDKRTRYHTLVYDNSQEGEGRLVKSRTEPYFEDAIGSHFGVLGLLSQLGY